MRAAVGPEAGKREILPDTATSVKPPPQLIEFKMALPKPFAPQRRAFGALPETLVGCELFAGLLGKFV